YLDEQAKNEPEKGMRKFYAKRAAEVRALPSERDLDWTKIYHVVVLAMVDEGLEVLRPSVASYAHAEYDRSKIIFILATEQFAAKQAEPVVEALRQEFGNAFHKFLVSVHPDGIPGEVRGKAGNFNHAARLARGLMEEMQVPLTNVLF